MSSSPPSNSSPIDSNRPHVTPSINELNDLVRDRNFAPFLGHAFQPGNVATSDLRQFTSLSQIIRTMELDLQRYRSEQQEIFQDLLDSQRYHAYIRPIFRYYQTVYPRQARRTRGHPYNQPGRSFQLVIFISVTSKRHQLGQETPAPASPTIAPETVDALLIPLPPPSPPASSSPSNESAESLSLGTQTHPIIIEDEDDEFNCTRCNQWGHRRVDCDTPIRRPSPCEVCAWTRQATCNHYTPTPAWIRRQQLNIANRG
jgi:hypothetical protein